MNHMAPPSPSSHTLRTSDRKRSQTPPPSPTREPSHVPSPRQIADSDLDLAEGPDHAPARPETPPSSVDQKTSSAASDPSTSLGKHTRSCDHCGRSSLGSGSTVGNVEDLAHDENCNVCYVQKSDPDPDGKIHLQYFNCAKVKLEIVKVDVKSGNEDYLKFAKATPDGRRQWRCVYETMVDGHPGRCNFESRKHLVKRHVESMHMNIKYVLLATLARRH
ncbi:unnamed protein product [Peniophora sp. CBMAI 1063]|nr:unnamed protein product [Peniophora sp. CBMAI 1063]